MPEIDTSREPFPAPAAPTRSAELIPTRSAELIQSRPASTPRLGLHRTGPFAPRFLLLYLVLLAVILMAFLPPLLNVNRFKRRIVTSISASLGRPVHLDSVSLVLLPVPGFRLANFVVAEDPAFGAEPVIHANQVQATLRFSSLWRRKVEFSKISLQEPSINLVHTAAGTWNVQSILLQAARIPLAPTVQTSAGPEPRFPYIEATGARVNLKAGDEKLPFSLTEADFALWLPGPQQWRIRMTGRPTRTDTSASDTGRVSLEGTLGRAERLDLIPLDLEAEWRNAPLGEATRLILGRDAGLRGDLRLNVALHGPIGNSVIKAAIQLNGVRRAEFVPRRALDIQAECQATATETFLALHGVRCSWPPPGEAVLLALTGDLPDTSNPASASFEVGTPALPAATLLDWLRIASPRVSPDLVATGTLSGTLSRSPNRSLSGTIKLPDASLSGPALGEVPLSLGEILVSSADAASSVPPASHRKAAQSAKFSTNPKADGFLMAPTTISLGGKDPALLEGRADDSGYTLHLSGTLLRSRLIALAAALPQFGDGLAAALPPLPAPPAISPAKELPIHVDLTSSRPWPGGQSWAETAPKPAQRSSHTRRR